MNDPDVLAALKAVIDPEIGVNIVDLGLVYRAERGPQGIQVTLTLTTPSCPLSEMVIEEVPRGAASEFCTDAANPGRTGLGPPWNPDRMSETACQLLR